MKTPTFEDRVERVYVSALRRRWSREFSFCILKVVYGKRMNKALALSRELDQYAEGVGGQKKYLEMVYFYTNQLPPDIRSLLHDLRVLALEPRERWRVKGWSCGCGATRAIFMALDKDYKALRVWCGGCGDVRGKATEADFIEALDHQNGVEILEEDERWQHAKSKSRSPFDTQREWDDVRHAAREAALEKLRKAGIDASSVAETDAEWHVAHDLPLR